MMTTEYDEALVGRVALAMCNVEREMRGIELLTNFINMPSAKELFVSKARAVIYPPAPPKTRLQVARELLEKSYSIPYMKNAVLNGEYDDDSNMRAVLAALALPAMED